MSNPNISDLDLNQAMKRVIDSQEDAFRVMVGAGTEFEIALDATDGDSVATKSLLASSSGELSSSSASGEFIAPLNIEGYSEFQILAKIDSAISGSCTLTLEISPEASGNIWLATSTNLAVTGSSDLISSLANPIAKRIRLSAGANTISGGSASVYLMARG